MGRAYPPWLEEAPRRPAESETRRLDVSKRLKIGMSVDTLRRRLEEDGFAPAWGTEAHPFAAALKRSEIVCSREWRIRWSAAAGW